MSIGDYQFCEEVPFLRNEDPSSREGFIFTISPLKPQIETPFSSQANSRI